MEKEIIETAKDTELVKPYAYPPLLPSKESRETLSQELSPFVQNIKLLQGTSGEIETQGNSAGNFFLSADDLNLSSKLMIIVIYRRDHALLFVKGSKAKESFHTDHPVFQEIKETTSDRPNKIDSAWGHDWLIYLPDFKRFVSYFCGRKSSRPCSEDILDCITPKEGRDENDTLAMEKPYTRIFELYSHFETKKFGPDYKCYVPKVTPMLVDSSSIVLDKDRATTMIDLFMKPVINEPDVEEVPESEESKDDER